MTKTKLRKGDEVLVVSGKYKDKKGKILRILGEKNRAIVEGVNVVYKTQRPSQDNPKGGIVQKEASIHLSNLLFWDVNAKKGTRLGFKLNENGQKLRFSKKSGKTLDS